MFNTTNGYSMHKTILATAASLSCGLLLASVGALPASASDQPTSPAEDFVASLASEAAQGDLAAADALREYQSLSAAETKEFDLSFQTLVSEGADPALVPGVEIIDTSGSTPAPLDGMQLGRAVGAGSWSAWCSQRVSLLGVVVTETRVDADFDTGGGRVTGIRNQRARVVANFQPLTNVGFKEIRKETGASGTVRALVRVERGPIKGLTSQTENWQSLTVNGSGNVTSCRWGY